MKTYVAVVSEVERYRELTEEEKEEVVRMILDRPYMDLRCDWAFKHILQNNEILKMLLSDFLPEQIESVSFLPNEIDKARADDKNIIMDVLCESADGRKFIVEMQRKKKNSFKNRMMYYGASMLHSQLKPNQSYSELTPVYVICFMDFKLTHETDQLVYRYSMRENESGEFYGNLLSIYLCELTRLKEKSLKGLDPVQSWFFILKNMRNFVGTPKDMGTRYAVVAEASRMHNLPDNEKIQYLRNMITEEERLDIGQAYYEDGLEEGMKKGIEKGKKIGYEENQREVIIRLLKIGMSPKDIATALDIPEETAKACI
jgi:predicted transposase/invertase (TIGR01784 family)